MRARRYTGQSVDPVVYVQYYILLEKVFKLFADYEKIGDTYGSTVYTFSRVFCIPLILKKSIKIEDFPINIYAARLGYNPTQHTSHEQYHQLHVCHHQQWR